MECNALPYKLHRRPGAFPIAAHRVTEFMLSLPDTPPISHQGLHSSELKLAAFLEE